MGTIGTSIEGIDLILHSQRGIYWPEQKSLFIADTHFGKEATFRGLGVPVPQGSTLGTLSTIAAMLRECQATRLILLGDMFHARSSITQPTKGALDAFFVEHSQLQFTLVAGNHDRNVRELFSHWPIEIVESGTRIGKISISHFPSLPSKGSDLLLCGHLHPAFRTISRTDSIGKLSCFWLSGKQLVLPAVGEFTGTQAINPSKNDRIWVVADHQVVELNFSKIRSKPQF